MKNISQFNRIDWPHLKYIFTDIDDTLTNDGQLPAEAYTSLWSLKKFGYHIIPVTGRPAGWCEMICRFWPVSGVIGENGAFYFRYENQKMKRWFAQSEQERINNQKKLQIISSEIQKQIPNSAISSDQFCRLSDLAIDFCEDIPPLSKNEIHHIVEIFQQHGATAKVSSIHVNGWFGDYNKVSTTEYFLENELHIPKNKMYEQCLFVGDSPNDEPMFEKFKLSFGVANIIDFSNQLKFKPLYVTNEKGGYGFSEICKKLIF